MSAQTLGQPKQDKRFQDLIVNLSDDSVDKF